MTASFLHTFGPKTWSYKMVDQLWIVRFNVNRPTSLYRNFFMDVEVTAKGAANAVLVAMQYLVEGGFNPERIVTVTARFAREGEGDGN